MALEARIESLDGLGEGLADHYKEIEGGGGFLLDVNSVAGYALENVAGLKDTLADRKAKAAERKNALAQFEGIDPAKARTALEKYDEIANWTPDQKAKEAIEAREAQLTDKHQKEYGDLKGKFDGLNSQLHDSLGVQSATAGIAKLEGNVRLLLPHVTGAMKLVEEDGKLVQKIVDEKGQVRVTMKANSTEDMGLDEFLAILKDSEEFMPAFAGSGASGGGGGGNPNPGRSRDSKDVVLSYEDSQDYQKFKKAEETAKKQGGTVIIQDHPGWHQ